MNKHKSLKNTISTNIGVRGEYRAVLREGGKDGRIKQDTGWKPNTILERGLRNFFETINSTNVMCLGTSNIAVDVMQDGLQGTFIDSAYTQSENVRESGGAPDYWTSIVNPFEFEQGINNVGTIQEFVLCDGSYEVNYRDDATIRVVLDAPIIKGEFDFLTIEHKLFFYPDITDRTGTITIGDGVTDVDYDYIMRPCGLGAYSYMTDRNEFPQSHFGSNVICEFNSGALINFDDRVQDDTGDIGSVNCIQTIESGIYGKYADYEAVADVDTCNGVFSKLDFIFWRDNTPDYIRGHQVQLLSTIGSQPFTKELTHEFRFTIRIYCSRYTP